MRVFINLTLENILTWLLRAWAVMWRPGTYRISYLQVWSEDRRHVTTAARHRLRCVCAQHAHLRQYAGRHGPDAAPGAASWTTLVQQLMMIIVNLYIALRKKNPLLRYMFR